MAMLPAGIENYLLQVSSRVCFPHLLISRNHRVRPHGTLDDPAIQTRLRAAHFSVGESSLNKNGESEADDFHLVVRLPLDHSTARSVGKMEQILPGLQCTAGTDALCT